jgi:hypothetical protein
MLKFYNISEVLVKAIAYNYYPTELVKYNNVTNSCHNVVELNEGKRSPSDGVMIVNSSKCNKSLGKLRHCLNDLFSEYKLDRIRIDGDEIGVRRFGWHTITFMQHLAEISSNYCKSMEDLGSLVDTLREFFNNRIDYDKELIERCGITSSNFNFNENFYEFVAIDLFGFTQPSIDVEQCIIRNYRDMKKREDLMENYRNFIEIVMKCLSYF